MTSRSPPRRDRREGRGRSLSTSSTTLPPSQDRLLTHRIVEPATTAPTRAPGDANDVTDVTAVTVGDMEARAILLVPYVGIPVAWLRAGQWLELALWLLLTIAAFVTARRNLEGEPPKWNLLRLLRDWRRARAGVADADRTDEDGAVVNIRTRLPVHRDRALARHRSVGPTALGVVLAVALAGVGMGTANAAFTARSTSGSNSVDGRRLGPAVRLRRAGRLSPTAFWLLDEKAGTATAPGQVRQPVRSRLQARRRRSVRPGGLPNNPGTSISTSGARLLLTSVYAAGPRPPTRSSSGSRPPTQRGGYLHGIRGRAPPRATPSDRGPHRADHHGGTGGSRTATGPASPKSVITTPLLLQQQRLAPRRRGHHRGVQFPSEHRHLRRRGRTWSAALTSRIDSYTGYLARRWRNRKRGLRRQHRQRRSTAPR